MRNPYYLPLNGLLKVVDEYQYYFMWQSNKKFAVNKDLARYWIKKHWNPKSKTKKCEGFWSFPSANICWILFFNRYSANSGFCLIPYDNRQQLCHHISVSARRWTCQLWNFVEVHQVTIFDLVWVTKWKTSGRHEIHQLFSKFTIELIARQNFPILIEQLTWFVFFMLLKCKCKW